MMNFGELFCIICILLMNNEMLNVMNISRFRQSKNWPKGRYISQDTACMGDMKKQCDINEIGQG